MSTPSHRRPLSPRSSSRTHAAFGLALALALGGAQRAAAGDWSWSFTPYAWATDVKTDVTIDDRRIGEREIEFSDLVDHLDFAAQGHVEGLRGRHGVMFDAFHVQLSDDGKRVALPAPLAGEALAGGDLELTILELGGVYNPRGDGQGFSLLYGARAIDRDVQVDARFDLGPGGTLRRSYEVSETLYDALLGMRYVGRLSDHWSYQLRGDASAGGTELTWSAGAGLGYTFDDAGRYTLMAGYRYLDVDFEQDHAVGTADVQTTLSGFLAGLRIAF